MAAEHTPDSGGHRGLGHRPARLRRPARAMVVRMPPVAVRRVVHVRALARPFNARQAETRWDMVRGSPKTAVRTRGVRRRPAAEQTPTATADLPASLEQQPSDPLSRPPVRLGRLSRHCWGRRYARCRPWSATSLARASCAADMHVTVPWDDRRLSAVYQFSTGARWAGRFIVRCNSAMLPYIQRGRGTGRPGVVRTIPAAP